MNLYPHRRYLAFLRFYYIEQRKCDVFFTQKSYWIVILFKMSPITQYQQQVVMNVSCKLSSVFLFIWSYDVKVNMFIKLWGKGSFWHNIGFQLIKMDKAPYENISYYWGLRFLLLVLYETCQEETFFSVLNEGSDQPEHLCSLFWVVAVYIRHVWTLGFMETVLDYVTPNRCLVQKQGR